MGVTKAVADVVVVVVVGEFWAENAISVIKIWVVAVSTASHRLAWRGVIDSDMQLWYKSLNCKGGRYLLRNLVYSAAGLVPEYIVVGLNF